MYNQIRYVIRYTFTRKYAFLYSLVLYVFNKD